MILAQVMHQWGDEQRIGVSILILLACIIALLATKKNKR